VRADLAGFDVAPMEDGGLWPKPKAGGATAEATDDGGSWPNMKDGDAGFYFAPMDDWWPTDEA
jgi:hypothetical protein